VVEEGVHLVLNLKTHTQVAAAVVAAETVVTVAVLALGTQVDQAVH